MAAFFAILSLDGRNQDCLGCLIQILDLYPFERKLQSIGLQILVKLVIAIDHINRIVHMEDQSSGVGATVGAAVGSLVEGITGESTGNVQNRAKTLLGKVVKGVTDTAVKAAKTVAKNLPSGVRNQMKKMNAPGFDSDSGSDTEGHHHGRVDPEEAVLDEAYYGRTSLENQLNQVPKYFFQPGDYGPLTNAIEELIVKPVLHSGDSHKDFYPPETPSDSEGEEGDHGGHHGRHHEAATGTGTGAPGSSPGTTGTRPNLQRPQLPHKKKKPPNFLVAGVTNAVSSVKSAVHSTLKQSEAFGHLVQDIGEHVLEDVENVVPVSELISTKKHKKHQKKKINFEEIVDKTVHSGDNLLSKYPLFLKSLTRLTHLAKSRFADSKTIAETFCFLHLHFDDFVTANDTPQVLDLLRQFAEHEDIVLCCVRILTRNFDLHPYVEKISGLHDYLGGPQYEPGHLFRATMMLLDLKSGSNDSQLNGRPGKSHMDAVKSAISQVGEVFDTPEHKHLHDGINAKTDASSMLQKAKTGHRRNKVRKLANLDDDYEETNYEKIATALHYDPVVRELLTHKIQQRKKEILQHEFDEQAELMKEANENMQMGKEALESRYIALRARFVKQWREFLYITEYPLNRKDMNKEQFLSLEEKKKWYKDLRARHRAINMPEEPKPGDIEFWSSEEEDDIGLLGGKVYRKKATEKELRAKKFFDLGDKALEPKMCTFDVFSFRIFFARLHLFLL